MLEIKSLSAGYNKKAQILKNINLKLREGKITALVGKNGCGKTTLVNCICKNISYVGEIKISGVDIKNANNRQLSRLVSVLPQRLNAPDIRVYDMVMYGRNPYMGLLNRPEKRDFDAVEKALELTETKELEDKYANRISGGELQRVYAAMVLAQDTPFIVLDEPGAHLDPSYTANLFKILRGSNKTIFIVMHDLSSALRLCDDIAVLNDGQICFSGACEECEESGILEEVFDVKKYTFSENGRTFSVFE